MAKNPIKDALKKTGMKEMPLEKKPPQTKLRKASDNPVKLAMAYKSFKKA